MSSEGNPVTYLSRGVCAILVASTLLLATPFSAGATRDDDDDHDQTNTVSITIQAGDATALATCLNIAKERERDRARAWKWWDSARRHAKKWDVGRAYDDNECDSKAVAEGGTVVLKNVDILVVQENKDGRAKAPSQANTVNITIRAGDATALADCLNIAKEQGRDRDRRDWKWWDDDRAQRENDCNSKAVAAGGDVILKNVEITVVQQA